MNKPTKIAAIIAAIAAFVFLIKNKSSKGIGLSNTGTSASVVKENTTIKPTPIKEVTPIPVKSTTPTPPKPSIPPTTIKDPFTNQGDLINQPNLKGTPLEQWHPEVANIGPGSMANIDKWFMGLYS